MEGILQDIAEFPFYELKASIVIIVCFLIFSYFIIPRSSFQNWWKYWKLLALVFIVIWFIGSSNAIGGFVSKENFNSLQKMVGTLKYDDNNGLYLELNQEEHFRIIVRLLDYVDNLSKYEEQPVTIWQKNHIVYQLEHEENVIYSLERSNEKVWLYVIWQIVRYYVPSFCWMMFYYFVFIRCFEE